ncbi:serine hydrolase, partial [Patescibacteria group bacterium]|nr:serine hydrolase [Patescibacteria group bacterium]
MKSYRANFYILIFFIFLGIVGAGIFILEKAPEGRSGGEYFFKNAEIQSKNFPVFGEAYLLPIERALTPEKKEGGQVIEIYAKSVLVIDDLSGKILYEKSSREKVAIASITKLATAAVILNLTGQNSPAGAGGAKYGLGREITIDKSAIEADGDNGSLVVGERIKARDLLTIMLIASSNDAAVALTEDIALFGGQEKDAAYFVGLMNEFARKNNLSDTRFANPAGIDDKNNYSTAADVIKLSGILLKEYPEIFEITRISEANVRSADGKYSHFIKNTNKLIGRLPNIVGGKTGYTDKAGESLLLIVKNPANNHKITAVIIGAKDRFAEMEKLINWVF